MNDENQQPDINDEEMPPEEYLAENEKQIDGLYIGAKIINARPMDEITFLRKYKGQYVPTDRENREGYMVMYPDNYTSWSPKTVFEIAYREVTLGELALMK